MDSPNFSVVRDELLSSSRIKRLGGIFKTHQFDIRLVGGAVRDLLMGVAPKDYDFATNATPDTVKAILEEDGIHVIETGLKHGTVTAMLEHEPFEITTLRVDKDHDGRRASVEFTNNWKEDALRRDLTVNAISMDLEGNIYDYFDGQEHLKAGRVVFVGDASQRIREDYLRILRYFRFHGRISLSPTHDMELLDTIRDTAEGLARISGERIWAEMERIVRMDSGPSLVETMHATKVFQYIGLEMVDAYSLEEFARVHRTCKNPIALTVALVHSLEEFLSVFTRWKFSANEKKLGSFVAERRSDELTLKGAQTLLVNGAPLEHVETLATYKGEVAIAREIVQWPVPVFPITGKLLVSRGYAQGPAMGALMARLKQVWIDSDFTMTADELCASV